MVAAAAVDDHGDPHSPLVQMGEASELPKTSLPAVLSVAPQGAPFTPPQSGRVAARSKQLEFLAIDPSATKTQHVWSKYFVDSRYSSSQSANTSTRRQSVT